MLRTHAIKSFILISAILFVFGAKGQILHTENFNVILDTTKVIKGNFIPSLRFRNVRERFFEFENIADLSIRLKHNGITIANKLEYARYGNEDIISGGFLFLEYRRILDTNKVAVEPFGLILWQGIRGLQRRYASGANVRWRIIAKPGTGLFAAGGFFYENEQWNYQGTSDSTLIPSNPTPVNAEMIRGQVYISWKQELGSLFDLDVSAYYHLKATNPLENYRLASSSQITYNFNQYLGLTVLYQNIYDPDPLVPIDKLFHDLTVGLSLSF